MSFPLVYLLFSLFFSVMKTTFPVFIYMYPLGCAGACRAGISFWYSFIVCLSALMNMIKHKMVPCARIVDDQAISID